MASSLMAQECGTACKEVAEFTLSFLVMSLQLSDKGKDKGFQDILIAITFDGNVIKLENLQENEVGGLKMIGTKLNMQTTSENFAEKLRSSPIMLNLSRGCSELGTHKLQISDCFIDALKCEEFSSELVQVDISFMENAEMVLAYKVSRPTDGPNMGKLFKGLDSKRKKQKIPTTKSEDTDIENISDCFDDLTDSELNLTCDTDICPMDEDDSVDHQTTSIPVSSSKSKSSRSRCCSDIATSLNLLNYSDEQTKFCAGCGGLSISGITCQNKNSFCETSNIQSTSKCCSSDVNPPCKLRSKSTVVSTVCREPSKFRVCSECFEDLSALPKCVPCPTCTERDQLQRRLVSFKSENSRNDESQMIRECVRSIFEEIFIETKDRLVNDWQRLKRQTRKKTKPVCVTKEASKSSKGTNKSTPRCNKIMKARIQSRFKKSKGLRVKNPGVIVGHESCKGNDMLVPKDMGWMWNVGISERGWRPGAVRKSVAKIMQLFLTPPEKPVKCPIIKDPPTLRVQKKDGEFTIVMNPVLNEDDKDVSPIVFKLEKTEDGKKRSKAQKILKKRGIKINCDCTSFKKCKCLSECDKAQIKFELVNLSKELCIKPQLSLCDLKDGSESEIDFEFTPPAAMKSRNPFKCKKPKVSVAATQCEPQKIVDDNEEEEKLCAKVDHMKNTGIGRNKPTVGGAKTAKKSGKITGTKGDKKSAKKKSKKTGESESDEGEVEVVRKPTRQVVKFMRELPSKKCCNSCAPKFNDFGCDVSYNHRFTTNYNPMYAQCPPQPPNCSQHQQTFCF